jgi:hypothetical protein
MDRRVVEFSKAAAHDHVGEEDKNAMDFKTVELDSMD